jgi:hypothetical protein
MTRKRIAGFKPRFEAGSPPTDVAETILKSVTVNNQDLRHLVEMMLSRYAAKDLKQYHNTVFTGICMKVL